MLTTFKKILSILFYILMSLFIVVLVKTELRKWFIFEGEPSLANTLLFWSSLIFIVLFGFCGSKLWPNNNKSLEKKEEGDNKVKKIKLTKRIIIFSLISVFAVCIIFTIFITIKTTNDKSLPPLPSISSLNINTNKQNCNFELINVSEKTFHFDSGDPEKLKNLEEDCYNDKKDDNRFASLFCNLSEREINKKETYIEVEGLIKNTGTEKEILRAMISKAYSNDDNKIYFGEDYQSVNKEIDSGVSLPFKLSIFLDRNKDSINKYYNKNTELVIDVYPWFTSCK